MRNEMDATRMIIDEWILQNPLDGLSELQYHISVPRPITHPSRNISLNTESKMGD